MKYHICQHFTYAKYGNKEAIILKGMGLDLQSLFGMEDRFDKLMRLEKEREKLKIWKYIMRKWKKPPTTENEINPNDPRLRIFDFLPEIVRFKFLNKSNPLKTKKLFYQEKKIRFSVHIIESSYR